MSNLRITVWFVFSLDGPLLNWNKIFDFVVVHLNQERYAQNFGTELMGLLKSFLEIPLYRSFVDSNAWIGNLFN